jgi:hypothetical protein
MASTLQDQVTTFFNVLGRLRPLAIVLVGTALVGTMFAGVAVRDAVQAFAKAKAVSAEEAAQVKLVRADLTDEDYTLWRHRRRSLSRCPGGGAGRGGPPAAFDRQYRPVRRLDPQPDGPTAQCQECGLGSQVHLFAGMR